MKEAWIESMAKKSIFSSVKIVVVTLLVVKLIGFLKQAVIAAYFGTSGEIDKFLLVSEFMENLGAAIFSAISVTFLTMYIDTLVAKGKVESHKFISNVLLTLAPVVFVLMILFLLFANQISLVIAPGYKGDDSLVIAKYIRLFSITMLNMFIYYVSNAVLEAEKVFFPGKIVGVIRSVSVISAIVFFAHKLGISAILLGVITYYILETLFILIYMIKKTGFHLYKPKFDVNIRRLLKLSLPLFVSYGVVQIQSVVDKAIASGLPEGSVATLSYSGYLYNTIHSILIGGLCTVIFSYFSSYVAEKEDKLLLETLYKYIRILTLILGLISILFIGYSKDIVCIVYQRGAFNASSTANVSLALVAYSGGLIFIGIRDVLIRAHYAYNANKQAMINGMIGVAANIIMSICFSHLWGVVGIALATSLASVCVATLSCVTVKKNVTEFKITCLFAFFVKLGGVCAVAAIAIIATNHFLHINMIFVNLCVKALISSGIYIFALWIFRVKEAKDVWVMVLEKVGHSH